MSESHHDYSIEESTPASPSPPNWISVQERQQELSLVYLLFPRRFLQEDRHG